MENLTDNNDILINLYLEAIDNKNVKEIANLITKTNGKGNIEDIVLELYNKNLLTSERLQFIAENCTKYLNLSNSLIKRLLKDDKILLSDIVFSHIKIYDDEIIKTFLFHYSYKNAMSNSQLTELISNEKYIIPKKNGTYLSNACKSENEIIVKFLVEHGADINKEDEKGETQIFYACSKGNEKIVKYLVKHGADINKKYM